MRCMTLCLAGALAVASAAPSAGAPPTQAAKAADQMTIVSDIEQRVVKFARTPIQADLSASRRPTARCSTP